MKKVQSLILAMVAIMIFSAVNVSAETVIPDTGCEGIEMQVLDKKIADAIPERPVKRVKFCPEGNVFKLPFNPPYEKAKDAMGMFPDKSGWTHISRGDIRAEDGTWYAVWEKIVPNIGCGNIQIMPVEREDVVTILSNMYGDQGAETISFCDDGKVLEVIFVEAPDVTKLVKELVLEGFASGIYSRDREVNIMIGHIYYKSAWWIISEKTTIGAVEEEGISIPVYGCKGMYLEQVYGVSSEDIEMLEVKTTAKRLCSGGELMQGLSDAGIPKPNEFTIDYGYVMVEGRMYRAYKWKKPNDLILRETIPMK